VNRRRLLRRLSEGAVRGAVRNVAFGDLIDLVEAFGFELARVNGSHHIFTHSDIPELLNLQEG